MENLTAVQNGTLTVPAAFTAETVLNGKKFLFSTTCPTSSGWFDGRHFSEHASIEEADAFAEKFNSAKNE